MDGQLEPIPALTRVRGAAQVGFCKGGQRPPMLNPASMNAKTVDYKWRRLRFKAKAKAPDRGWLLAAPAKRPFKTPDRRRFFETGYSIFSSSTRKWAVRRRE